MPNVESARLRLPMRHDSPRKIACPDTGKSFLTASKRWLGNIVHGMVQGARLKKRLHPWGHEN